MSDNLNMRDKERARGHLKHGMWVLTNEYSQITSVFSNH